MDNSLKKICLTLFLVLIILFLGSKVNASSLNVPKISSFTPSKYEKNALQLDYQPNNTGTNFSIEVINGTLRKAYNLAGSTKSFTFQNLESGIYYVVQIRACTNDQNNYSCSNWSTSSKAIINNGTKTSDKYTVTFKSNGGSGSMSNEIFTKNVSKKLSSNKFKRKNYKFKGWSTSKKGKVVYKNNQSIKVSKNLTLYAIWEMDYITPNGKIVEAKASTGGVEVRDYYYSSSKSHRHWKYVIRSTNPVIANDVAKTAKLIQKNNKIKYSQNTSKIRKTWTSIKKKGPNNASGYLSCGPTAMASLKYALRNNSEKSVASNIDVNWRSYNIPSKMKKVNNKTKSRKNGAAFKIYKPSSSEFKNYKKYLKRGYIVVTSGHTAIVQ